MGRLVFVQVLKRRRLFATYTRWNAFDEMNALFRDMDRLFRRSLAENTPVLTGESEAARDSSPNGRTGREAIFTPVVEAFRKDNNVVLRAELQGVDPSDVVVEDIGNQLHLRGERKRKEEIHRNNYYLSEASYGNSSVSLRCRRV